MWLVFQWNGLLKNFSWKFVVLLNTCNLLLAFISAWLHNCKLNSPRIQKTTIVYQDTNSWKQICPTMMVVGLKRILKRKNVILISNHSIQFCNVYFIFALFHSIKKSKPLSWYTLRTMEIKKRFMYRVTSASAIIHKHAKFWKL